MNKPDGTTYSVIGGFDSPDRERAVTFYKILTALNFDGERVRAQIYATTIEGNREIRQPVQFDD